jgi:hypothetical protein
MATIRNNTDFSASADNFLRQQHPDREKVAFLKEYQWLISQFYAHNFTNSVAFGGRGMLLAWYMGIGKTMAAVAIVMDLIFSGKGSHSARPIVLLAMKSLHANFRANIHKYAQLRKQTDPTHKIATMSAVELDHWIDENVRFVTANSSRMGESLANSLSLGASTFASRADNNQTLFAAADGSIIESNRQMRSEGADSIIGGAESILEKKLNAITDTGDSTALDGKFLIVDEVHNLCRSIVNGGTNGRKFYDLVMGAKRLNLLFLSGTPIATESYELVPMFNMLAGKEIFSPYYVDWKRNFADSTGAIKNKWIFQNMISGLVSFIKSDFVPGDTHFPRDQGNKVIRVKMTKQQNFVYLMARDKELKENQKMTSHGTVARSVPLSKGRSANGTSYKVASRQVSICSPIGLGGGIGGENTASDPKNMFKFSTVQLNKINSTADFNSNKFKTAVDIIRSHSGQIGFVYCDFVSAGGIASFARYLEICGYSRYRGAGANITALDTFVETEFEEVVADDFMPSEGGVAPARSSVAPARSSTFASPVDNIVNNDTHSTFAPPANDIVNGSYDENKYPIFGGMDEQPSAGEAKVGLPPSGSRLNYGIFSGNETPEEREQVRVAFNHANNMHGSVISVILLSSTGATGLDLAHCRYGIILSPVWTGEQAEQIKYRGFRNGSHIDMPEAEQTMTMYTLLSVPIDRPVAPSGEPRAGVEPAKGVDPDLWMSTDEEIFEAATSRTIANGTFIEAMAQSACDCTFYGKTPGCRMCAPSSKRLFADTFEETSKMQDPCAGFEKKTIDVKSVTVDGVEFRYSVGNGAFGYDIFVYDKLIAGWRKLPAYDGRYQQVIDALSFGPEGPHFVD